jgi:predicted DNA-binding ribbon-helix-helix protein
MTTRKNSTPAPPWTKALAAVAECKRGLITYNVVIAGRRTSCRLDAPTWSALGDVARREGVSVNELCSEIAATRPPHYRSRLRFVRIYSAISAAAPGAVGRCIIDASGRHLRACRRRAGAPRDHARPVICAAGGMSVLVLCDAPAGWVGRARNHRCRVGA